MKRFILIFCVFLFGECHEDERGPKFFFGPKAETVYVHRKVPKLVTEFVPSSCIVVEPTLPACRHVRSLEIYPSVPTRITQTQVPQQVEPQNWKPQPSEQNHHVATPPLRNPPQQVKFTTPTWSWNLFNLFRVQNYTHTATKTEYITTRIQDPHTVVSFYVKGCRPSRLPFNLPECQRAEEPKPEKGFVVMAPLKFIPSGDTPITPSKTENVVKEAEESGEGENDNNPTATDNVQPKDNESFLYQDSN